MSNSPENQVANEYSGTKHNPDYRYGKDKPLPGTVEVIKPGHLGSKKYPERKVSWRERVNPSGANIDARLREAQSDLGLEGNTAPTRGKRAAALLLAAGLTLGAGAGDKVVDGIGGSLERMDKRLENLNGPPQEQQPNVPAQQVQKVDPRP